MTIITNKVSQLQQSFLLVFAWESVQKQTYLVTKDSIVQLHPATASGEDAFVFLDVALPFVGVGEGEEEEGKGGDGNEALDDCLVVALIGL